MGALVGVFVFVVGTMVGSFLNVCILRFPAGESIVRPRSRCPRCGVAIAPRDNVPILSWLVLRGRCRACQERISPMYPLVELATATIFLAAYLSCGATFLAVRLAVFATVLLGIAVTDARERLIPDGFTVFGLLWVLATSVAAWWTGADGLFAGPAGAAIGACAGAGAVAIVGWLGEVAFRKEAMGFGDVTLMAVVGAALGPLRALLVIFIGAVIAVVTLLVLKLFGQGERLTGPGTDADSPRSHHIPFGVFLAPAAILSLLWGETLIRGYMNWVLTGSFT